MRQLGWAFGGVLLGFVLGGVQPRRSMGELQERFDALQDENIKLRNTRSSRIGALGDLNTLLPSRGLPTRTEKGAPEPVDRDAPDVERSAGRLDGPEAPADLSPTDVPATDPLQEFDAAVDVQAARAAQSRAALAEQAGFSDDDLAAFDTVTAELNASLAAYSDELVDIALFDGPPNPSDLLAITHEVSGVLLDGQRAVEAIVGEDAMGEVDPEALLILNQIDLGILRGSVEAVTAQ